MCTVSMITDHYLDKWPAPQPTATIPNVTIPQPVTREEIDSIKRDLAEMKALLVRAKQYDADNGEPDCEMADKVAKVRQICEMVGIDIDTVFPPSNAEAHLTPEQAKPAEGTLPAQPVKRSGAATR